MQKLIEQTFKELHISEVESGSYSGTWGIQNKANTLKTYSPINSVELAQVGVSTIQDYENILKASQDCFKLWSKYPSPKRGEIIRQIAHEIRRLKEPLGNLISLEVGKIKSEGLGEIQEVIDIADFAVGLSRQLYGKTMHSERPNHRMYEQWHPLGSIGVISAFNFPAAVWAWNAMIAAVCGNTVIWKPSELTPLVAIALTKIASQVASSHGFPALFTLLTGDGPEIGIKLAADTRLPLISATGSCHMGRSVGQSVAARFGRSLLELGGNNALIVLEDADLELATRAVAFGAVGTAGQRCTTTRRLLLHKNIRDKFLTKLINSYSQIKIGNPLESGILMGPLISMKSVDSYKNAINTAKTQGGKILFGGNVLEHKLSSLYVEPCIILANSKMEIVKEETFAPILYVLEINSLDDAINIQNSVPQGLSSSLFTTSIKSAELFLSSRGSDCGIANINIGTSGAEIGGAFGGEKETGGGIEAGSDSWKAYMRRQTNTINWSDELPLAQGIEFN